MGVAPEPVNEVPTVTAEDVVDVIDTLRGTVISEVANMEQARMESKMTHTVALLEKLSSDGPRCVVALLGRQRSVGHLGAQAQAPLAA